MNLKLKIHNIICWILGLCTLVGAMVIPYTKQISFYEWHHQLSQDPLDIMVHVLLVCATGIFFFYSLSCWFLVGNQENNTHD